MVKDYVTLNAKILREYGNRTYYPLRTHEPDEQRSSVYAPYEMEGYVDLPQKRIFEEEVMKDYVIPFEYEKSGGSYRYGSPENFTCEYYGGCGVDDQRKSYASWSKFKSGLSNIKKNPAYAVKKLGTGVASGELIKSGFNVTLGKVFRGAGDLFVSPFQGMEEGMKMVMYGAVGLVGLIVLYIMFKLIMSFRTPKPAVPVTTGVDASVSA